MTYLFWAALIAYVLSLYLIRWVLLLKSREPTSSIAWILLIIALPVLGGLLFLVFGINRVERKAVGMKRQTRRVLGPNLPQIAEFETVLPEFARAAAERLVADGDADQPDAGDLRQSDRSPGRRIADDGTDRRGHRRGQGDAAPRILHLETGPQRNAAARHADRKGPCGGRGPLLYDGIGSIALGRHFLRPMRDAGHSRRVVPAGAGFHASLVGQPAEPSQNPGRGRADRLHRRNEHRRRVSRQESAASEFGAIRTCGFTGRRSCSCNRSSSRTGSSRQTRNSRCPRCFPCRKNASTWSRKFSSASRSAI